MDTDTNEMRPVADGVSQSALIKALAPPTDSDLVRQGAEAAARAKMLVRGISRALEDHYSVLEQRLTWLAIKMERG